MVRPSLRERLRRIVRSMGVGALATLTDLVVLTVLVSAVHLSPRVASPFGLVAGVLVQFVGNKIFAFEDRSSRWARQGAQFFAVEALGFALNLWLFDLAVRSVPLPLLVLRLVVTNAVYFGVCLPLWSRIFRPIVSEGGAR